MKLSYWNIIGFCSVMGTLLNAAYYLIKDGFVGGNAVCVSEPTPTVAVIEMGFLFVGMIWLLSRALRSDHAPPR